MKIRLLTDISGSRNGQPWPSRGAMVELPDSEALTMCQNGTAEPLDGSGDDIETATVADDSSTRGLTTMTAGAVVPHQQDASGALIPPQNNDGDQQSGGDSAPAADKGTGDAGGDASTPQSTGDTAAASDTAATPAKTTPAKTTAATPAKKTAATKPATGK